MQPCIYIANWKMNKPLTQAIAWYQTNAAALTTLAQVPGRELIICPSFEALYPLAGLAKIGALGAQDCSEHDTGPYTGQVSARSLKQAGCSYSIVGHSERRRAGGDTESAIAQKILRLFEQDIRPIICIGESSQEHSQGLTNSALERQITPIIETLNTSDIPCIIAYEPIWAIGSGTTPHVASLSATFAHLTSILSPAIERSRYRLIYGGSVNEKTAPELNTIKSIEGFLIGDASLDFQKLQKIVLLRS